MFTCTAMQSQNTVYAYFTGKQILIFWLCSALYCFEVSLPFTARTRVRVRTWPTVKADVYIIIFLVFYMTVSLDIKKYYSSFKKMHVFQSYIFRLSLSHESAYVCTEERNRPQWDSNPLPRALNQPRYQ